ncbi:tripartite tricarboxylate transporter substrate-binding protein [Roseomonas sp. NAR14]|uniref:Tripartite tricarboxylate transporter substrate-binding protein n=1 Tax=Roseomonas acroporae TaxID=2937791 RepID=A0A9X1YDB2_9PROT|nr:tripartite tricarboxylate transporter substrate-binding protein [Roseomonas acroporae]MCK8784441.1 tripartite tricarboxylate transporter substrate-binding protein [Roseomonas acroporae]
MHGSITRRGLGALGAGLLAAPALPRRGAAAGTAADWPDRPVTLVVPFTPGGASDTLARQIGQHFPRFANGQPLVVENRSGAGGTVGGGYVAAQQPNGYTLLMADVGANAIGRELNPRLGFDPMTAFTPIIHLVNLPAVFFAHPDVPERTLPEVIASAKARPDSFSYASAGVGNGSHLFMALLCRRAGVSMIHVPYRSGSEIVTSVMRGETQLGFPSLSSALGALRAGSIRPIAMGNPEGSPALPGIPPVSRVLPGFDVAVWYGVAAPAGMAPDLAHRINEVFGRIAALPAVREAVFSTQAGQVVGGSSEDFARFLRREYDTWTPLIREGGIRTE